MMSIKICLRGMFWVVLAVQSVTACAPVLLFCKSASKCGLQCPEGTHPVARQDVDLSLQCAGDDSSETGPFFRLRCLKNGDEDGCYVVEKGQYLAGHKQGRWETIGDDGIRLVSEYARGKRHGKWRGWYLPDVTLGQHTAKTLSEEGKQVGYVGDFVDGTGTFAEWYPNGLRRSVGHYKDNIPDGFWSSWNGDGGKASEGHFLSGLKHGLWTVWHGNGQGVSAAEYANDQLHGAWTEWYANKQKKVQGTYVEGHKSGIWRHYSEDGDKLTEGAYANGKREGLWDFPRGFVYYAEGRALSVSPHFPLSGRKDLAGCTKFETCAPICPDGAVLDKREEGSRGIIECKLGDERRGPYMEWFYYYSPDDSPEDVLPGIESPWVLSLYREYSEDLRHGDSFQFDYNAPAYGFSFFQKMCEGKHVKGVGKETCWSGDGKKKTEVETTEAYGEEFTTETTYDDAGKVVSIMKRGQGSNTAYMTDFEYWEDGELKSKKEDGPVESGREGHYREIVAKWDEAGRKLSEYETITKDLTYMGDQGDQEVLVTRSEWHANGQIRLVAHYKDGKHHGKTTAWNDRGQVVASGEHVDGEMVGEWITKEGTLLCKGGECRVVPGSGSLATALSPNCKVRGAAGNFRYCCKDSDAKHCFETYLPRVAETVMRTEGRRINKEEAETAAETC